MWLCVCVSRRVVMCRLLLVVFRLHSCPSDFVLHASCMLSRRCLWFTKSVQYIFASHCGVPSKHYPFPHRYPHTHGQGCTQRTKQDIFSMEQSWVEMERNACKRAESETLAIVSRSRDETQPLHSLESRSVWVDTHMDAAIRVYMAGSLTNWLTVWLVVARAPNI